MSVDKLMTQLKRVEKACAETESRLIELKAENKKLYDKNSRANSSIKDLTLDLKEYKDKLHNANSQVVTATVRLRISSSFFFHSLEDVKASIF